jgi:hypothetical protein
VMKISAAGSAAQTELTRMMTEEVAAVAEAVAIFTRGGSGRKSYASLPDARKCKSATVIQIGAVSQA